MGTAATTSVAIGADHGGFALKEKLKQWLAKAGHRVVDCGSHDGARCDYPEVAARVARKVASAECSHGVIVDGAGIGSSMAANKIPGVRAALCYDISSARNSREHNNANVVTLGAGLIGQALAEQIVATFLSTSCSAERHLRRVAMISALEQTGTACGPCAVAASGSQTKSVGQNVVAETPRQHHNGSPAGASSSFQAQAASWLRSEKPSPTMNEFSSLTAQDFERVTQRIAELMGAGSMRDGRWCFGDVCIDPAVARLWVEAGVGRISAEPGAGTSIRQIAKYIDHTLLKPTATAEQVRELCAEAAEYGFASVCVNPYWVKRCAAQLRGSGVKVCTVVGFPLGANCYELKAMEARRAIREGAREIDMVINIGALKSGDDDLVYKDIRAVVDACEDGRAICKVIIETALLNDEEKVRACVLARKARADFVKTSTGFSTGGATAADVALMSRAVSGARMGVKASGGVRSLADLEQMVGAGATRIGASAGIAIMKEAGTS